MENEVKNANILEELTSDSGYEIALFTTFNFEINFFNKAIVSNLFDKGIKKIDVFVDAKELSKSLDDYEESCFGKKYFVSPIDLESAFHPKVILLLGTKKAKLFVASANLTTSGYLQNEEVYNVFALDSSSKKHIGLVASAISFFEKLYEITPLKDEEVFQEIKKYFYYGKFEDSHEEWLLENTEKPILEQIFGFIDDEVLSIDIAVPYYDNRLEALSKIKKRFPASEINLYIQEEYAKFSKSTALQSNVISLKDILPYRAFKDFKKTKFYHGKVFRFNTKENSYILYGSANCTSSALNKSYLEKGNIECSILEKGDTTEFDRFFDMFDIDNTIEVVDRTIEYDEPVAKSFIFKYGILDDNLSLLFKYKNREETVLVSLNGCTLEYEYRDDFFIVVVPNVLLEEVDNVFTIDIDFKDKRDTVRVWYVDNQVLADYRKDDAETYFRDILLDEDFSTYREHMLLLLKSMALSYDEYEKIKKISDALNPSNKTLESIEEMDEDEIDEDFVIDIDLVEEYTKQSRFIKEAYQVSSKFAKRFFDMLGSSFDKSNRELDSKDNSSDKGDAKHVNRRATPLERRFARFVMRKVKTMLTDEYVDIVDFEHFKTAIGVVMDIIEIYRYDEHITDIFTDEYVNSISMELLIKLLNKKDVVLNESTRDELIRFAFVAIIKNSGLNEKENRNYKLEHKNRVLLMAIEKFTESANIDFRNDYKRAVRDAATYLNERDMKVDEATAILYIDELFGYKTKEQLESLLIKNFGENYEIKMESDTLLVEIETDEMGSFLTIDEKLLQEVNKTFRKGGRFAKTKVVIRNIFSQNAHPNPPTVIEYFMKNDRLDEKTVLYRDGTSRKYTYEYGRWKLKRE